MDVSFPTQLELMKIQHLVACHHPATGYCTHTCCVGALWLISLDTSLLARLTGTRDLFGVSLAERTVAVNGLLQMVSDKGLGRSNDSECSKCLQT